MASNRIDTREAKTIWFPKFTIEYITIEELLSKEINKLEVVNRVPINTPLLASIEREGFKNPFLCMSNYWCIAGQQRLRVAYAIKEKNPDWNAITMVYRLLEHPWEPLLLWKDNGQKEVAVYFQMLELIFKSLYYTQTKDDTGNDMTYYEELGDRNTWNHDS